MDVRGTLRLTTLLLGITITIAAQVANSGFGDYPASPKAEPLVETVHGVTVSDVYRWMERHDRRDEMIAWIKASSTQTTETLGKLPGYGPLLKELESASRASVSHSSVKLAGGHVFFLELAPDGNVPVLKVRENGKDRILLDPMAGVPKGSHRTINNYSPSRDGRLVAIHMAEGGGEVGATRFYDVATGKTLDDELKPIWGEFSVNWLDNQRVTYTRMNDAERQEDAMENMSVFLHRLGTSMAADVPVQGSRVGLGFPMQPVEFPLIVTRLNSRWAIAVSGNARADVRIAFSSLESLKSGKPQWKPFVDYDDKVNDFDFSGDIFYYLTTAHDPNGEIRSLDLNKGRLAQSQQVLAANGRVLKGVIATNAGIYVTAMAADASSRILFIAKGVAEPLSIQMPFTGSISDPSVTPDGSTLTLDFDGFQKNTTYYRLDGATMLPIGLADTTLQSAEDMRALAAQDSTLILAEAKDGTDQLFTIGLNDHRVDPWMSAKLVAMMRAKWGNQHLVLIRCDADVGHGIGSSRDQSLKERADIYSFLLNRFGQPSFMLPDQKEGK